LGEAGYDAVANAVGDCALREARRRLGQQGEQPRDPKRRLNVDEFQLRKQALKRFVSSVLWLRQEVAQQTKWVREILFAIAASVAMVFAVVAAFYHGTTANVRAGEVWVWVLIVVLAYAGKDRLKASLQAMFSKWIANRFPDRYWRLTTELDGSFVCRGEERTRFVDLKDLPDEVRSAHDAHAEFDVEPQALPISVVWHHKGFELQNPEIAEVDPRFSAITEIFRLDVSHWITHTSDPKEHVFLANVGAGRIQASLARRLYEMDIVYRVSRVGEAPPAWSRCSVALNRNGLRRIAAVSNTGRREVD
jgi:hypothetical protein